MWQPARATSPCWLRRSSIPSGWSDVLRSELERHTVLYYRDAAPEIPDSEFDVVLSAFALRNFADLDRCLSEIHRVMSPGGMAVIIDLCAPRRFPMRQLFSLYQHCIMPLMGRLMAHDRDAYSYLPRTMAAIPQGEDMAQHFRQAGFTDVTYRYLPFGMCCMYVGK